MADENVENKGFKVSDRRFSVRGYEDEEASDLGEERRIISLDESGDNVGPASSDARQADVPQSEAAQSQSAQEPQPEGGDSPSDEEDKSFEMLIAIVQTNALAAMGIHPQTGERVGGADPRNAKMFVDLLGALEQKTKGNLSPDEEQLLHQVRSDLQMAYVREVGFG